MSTAADRELVASYTPTSDRTSLSREALLALGLRCIITGKPFPPQLEPTVLRIASVYSAEEGVQRILAGPVPTLAQ